jgi:hypothetical protein
MKILFYSLHAGIWPHALPENRLVCELAERGHETVYVSCTRSFPKHCTTYSAFLLPVNAPRAAKDQVCATCVRNARTLTAGSGARHLQLKHYLQPQDDARIDALVADVTRENYLDFTYEGVEVGRIVTYELFLQYKKMSPRLNDEEWEYYRIYLRNSLLSLIGFIRIYTQEKPDAVFFYSPQYDVNGVAAAHVIRQGSRAYFIEGSSSNAERYSALRVWDWGVHGLVNPALSHWDTAKHLVTEEDARRVTGHFLELLRGRSFAVYSEPVKNGFSLRARFGVPDGAKIVLATLSSFDEAYAAYMIGKFPERKVKSPVFRDQFEWIQKTIAHVANRPDIFLIVRVHPRDYPNKRDPRQSEQAALWEKMFEARPANVAINWPQDKLSIYSIFGQVDAVVTGWSATGTEALAFGVPVVTYDRFLPSYPADIHLTGESEAEYLANIDRALQCGRSLANAQNAYRWLAASFSQGTVRIPPPQTIGEYWPTALSFRIVRKIARLLFGHLVRRHDAKQRMALAGDAERLDALISQHAASLYDVLDTRRVETLSPATLDKTIGEEIASFAPFPTV